MLSATRWRPLPTVGQKKLLSQQDWAVVRTGILEWVALTGGLPLPVCTWDDPARGQDHKKCKVRIRLWPSPFPRYKAALTLGLYMTVPSWSLPLAPRTQCLLMDACSWVSFWFPFALIVYSMLCGYFHSLMLQESSTIQNHCQCCSEELWASLETNSSKIGLNIEKHISARQVYRGSVPFCILSNILCPL